MIRFLSKIFIHDSENYQSPEVRQKYGMLCGIVGIALNVILFAGKWVAGMVSGSIAITADAFNNLSDAGSSVITLFGFKLSGQKPDPEHPFGHGRMEYISGLLVSVAILIMGFELAKSSVEKILHPQAIDSSPVVYGILIASILVKLYMYFYNRSVGKKISSAAMKATATDSLSDTVATSLVLLATLISQQTGFLLDGWFGVLVAVFILFSGVNALKDTVDPLLGQAPDQDLVDQIYDMVMSHDIVEGVHDLIVHDYGPGRRMITLHAEVPAKGDLLAIHDEIDNIESELRNRLQCQATIHMDPIESDNEEVARLRQVAANMAKSIDPKLTIHDFRMVKGDSHTNLIFDIAVPYDCKLTDAEVSEKMKQMVMEMEDHQYFAVLQIDRVYV